MTRAGLVEGMRGALAHRTRAVRGRGATAAQQGPARTAPEGLAMPSCDGALRAIEQQRRGQQRQPHHEGCNHLPKKGKQDATPKRRQGRSLVTQVRARTEAFEKQLAKALREVGGPGKLREVLDATSATLFPANAAAAAAAAAATTTPRITHNGLRHIALVCARHRVRHPLVPQVVDAVAIPGNRNFAVIIHALWVLGYSNEVCRLARMLEDDSFRAGVLHAHPDAGAGIGGREWAMLLRALAKNQLTVASTATAPVVADVCTSLEMIEPKLVVSIASAAGRLGLMHLAEAKVGAYFTAGTGGGGGDGDASPRIAQLLPKQMAELLAATESWVDTALRQRVHGACVGILTPAAITAWAPHDQASVARSLTVHLASAEASHTIRVERLVAAVLTEVAASGFRGWLASFQDVARAAAAAAAAAGSGSPSTRDAVDTFCRALQDVMAGGAVDLKAARAHHLVAVVKALRGCDHGVPPALPAALRPRLDELRADEQAEVRGLWDADVVHTPPDTLGLKVFNTTAEDRKVESDLEVWGRGGARAARPAPTAAEITDADAARERALSERIRNAKNNRAALTRVLDDAGAALFPAGGEAEAAISDNILRNVAFACAKAGLSHWIVPRLIKATPPERVGERSFAMVVHALARLGYNEAVSRLARRLANDAFRKGVMHVPRSLAAAPGARKEWTMLLTALANNGDVRVDRPAVEPFLRDICASIDLLEPKQVVAVASAAARLGLTSIAQAPVDKYFTAGSNRDRLRRLEPRQVAELLTCVDGWARPTGRRQIKAYCAELITPEAIVAFAPRDRAEIVEALVTDQSAAQETETTRGQPHPYQHHVAALLAAVLDDAVAQGFRNTGPLVCITRLATAAARFAAGCGTSEAEGVEARRAVDAFFKGLALAIAEGGAVDVGAERAYHCVVLAWAYMRAGHLVPDALADAVLPRYLELDAQARVMFVNACKDSPCARDVADAAIDHIQRHGWDAAAGTVERVALLLRYLRASYGGESAALPVAIYVLLGEVVARHGVRSCDQQALAALLYEANGGVVADAVIREHARRGIKSSNGRTLAMLAYCHAVQHRRQIPFWRELEAVAAAAPIPNLSLRDCHVLVSAVLAVRTKQNFPMLLLRVGECLARHDASLEGGLRGVLQPRSAARLAIGLADAADNAASADGTSAQLLRALHDVVRRDPSVLSHYETVRLAGSLIRLKTLPRELFNQLRAVSAERRPPTDTDAAPRLKVERMDASVRAALAPFVPPSTPQPEARHA